MPDIPKDKTVESENDVELRDVIYEVTENIGSDPSELYATVQDKSIIDYYFSLVGKSCT